MGAIRDRPNEDRAPPRRYWNMVHWGMRCFTSADAVEELFAEDKAYISVAIFRAFDVFERWHPDEALEPAAGMEVWQHFEVTVMTAVVFVGS